MLITNSIANDGNKSGDAEDDTDPGWTSMDIDHDTDTSNSNAPTNVLTDLTNSCSEISQATTSLNLSQSNSSAMEGIEKCNTRPIVPLGEASLREISKQNLNLDKLFKLVKKSTETGNCIDGKDVVLLLGSTGCGKTTSLLYLAS
jgi:flagellar biosynthesis GTPase FlhF